MMAEGSLSDDLIIIPNTPSPVFDKREASTGLYSRNPSVDLSHMRRHHSINLLSGKRQHSVNLSPSKKPDLVNLSPVQRHHSLNLSPLKESKPMSSSSFSPPGGLLSLPGQVGFARERAEALKKKKLKDGIANKLESNGLSPVKRLSPLKAGFIKSSELLKSPSGSSVSGNNGRSRSSCALEGLKRDISPSVYASPDNLYKRIKSKHTDKLHSKRKTPPSSTIRWPSDSDSSTDELLSSAVDSVPKYKCKRKTANGNTHMTGKSVEGNKVKKPTSQTSVSGMLASSPSKPKTYPFQSLLDSDDEFDSVIPKIPVPSHASFKSVASHSDKSSSQSSFKSPAKHKTSTNNLAALSPTFETTDLLSRKAKSKGEKKLKRSHEKMKGRGSSQSDWLSSRNVCDDDRQTGPPIDLCSPDLMSLSGICANLSRFTDSTDTDSNTLSRRARKRKTETLPDRSPTKLLKTIDLVKKRTSVKVSSPKATPETQNVINVISQLEKDEEVARKLQEELDREFALNLQQQAEASRSTMPDDLVEEEEGYRYHSPFGDIRHRTVGSPRRRHNRRQQQWHMFDPLRVAGNRDEDIPRDELAELIADAANSIHAGLEYEMMMGGGRRRGGRRGRGSRGGGVLSNFMFASPNGAGEDYDQLMELGELIGDAKQKGLNKNELQRLPTTVYKADENNANTECHICMGDYEAGENLKILPCFHNFHDKCIDRWIKEYHQCQTAWIHIRPDKRSGLIWAQTICKGYQQTTLAAKCHLSCVPGPD